MYQPFTEEQIQIRDLVRDFTKKYVAPVALHYDQLNEHPTELIQKMRKQLEINGLCIPVEYGGMGYGAIEQCIVTEEMSYGCMGIALAFGYTSLGMLPILKGASREMAKKWLEPVISGDHGIAFCLTEPSAGSDVPSITTTAEKKGDTYILNGVKQWITGGGSANAFTVFAVTDKRRGTRGVSCFYVPSNLSGVSLGKKEDKLGIRASDTRQIVFENVEIPKENLIGKENMGFIYALQTLNTSRPYVAALGVGTAQAALDHAIKYAKEREQFSQKILNFQIIQHMLADMSIGIETARAITYKAASMVDSNDTNLPKFSAIAKAYASDVCMKVTIDAIQVFGGYGYTKEYPVEKLMRDAKILSIFEGTTQIQKNEIAAYLIKEAAQNK